MEFNQITGLNRQFGYDNLNRLTSAMDVTSVGTVPTNGLNQQYILDNWGNLVQMGNNGFSQYINNQNQVGTYGYDAAGRLRNDQLMQYTYDSDGMLLTSSDGVSYSYDGGDQRSSIVNNGSESDYYYFGGQLVAINSPTGWTDMIYAEGQRIAKVAGTQTAMPVYSALDHVGSEVASTDNTGTVVSAMDYTPFGQLLSGTNTDGFIFTGLLRDNDGLDHADFRQYSSATGRWTTPDPYDGSYSLNSPQSLNRYGYVGNMPLAMVDPSGLDGGFGGIPTMGGCGGAVAEGGANIPLDVACIGGLLLEIFSGGKSGFHGNVQAQREGKTVRSNAKNWLNSDTFGVPYPGLMGALGGALGGGIGTQGCEFGACGSSFTDYSEAQTRAQLQQAYLEATSGFTRGLLNIFHNSNGKYDFKLNRPFSTWTLCGRKMNAAQMGNFIAGYESGAYDWHYYTGVVALAGVNFGGVFYHMGQDDPLDSRGRDDIARGNRFGVLRSLIGPNSLCPSSGGTFESH